MPSWPTSISSAPPSAGRSSPRPTSRRRSGLPRRRSSSTRNACWRTACWPAPTPSILKYDIGLAESERALQINPSDTEALLTRAAVLLWTGRIDESIAAAEAAMRLNVNIGSEAALNLGLAYLLAHRYADAVRLLEAARARYPTHPLLDFPLAAAYAELGRTDDALDAARAGKAQESALRPGELRLALPGPGAATPGRGKPAQGRLAERYRTKPPHREAAERASRGCAARLVPTSRRTACVLLGRDRGSTAPTGSACS